MTLHVAPRDYQLDPGEGEARWFADGLLTYKTSGDQTSGPLALAEVNAPRGCGSPRTGITTKTRPTALTRSPMDLPTRHQRDAALLAAAQVQGLDIVEP